MLSEATTVEEALVQVNTFIKKYWPREGDDEATRLSIHEPTVRDIRIAVHSFAWVLDRAVDLKPQEGRADALSTATHMLNSLAVALFVSGRTELQREPTTKEDP